MSHEELELIEFEFTERQHFELSWARKIMFVIVPLIVFGILAGVSYYARAHGYDQVEAILIVAIPFLFACLLYIIYYIEFRLQYMQSHLITLHREILDARQK